MHVKYLKRKKKDILHIFNPYRPKHLYSCFFFIIIIII